MLKQNYKNMLAKKLVFQFQEKFFEKIGYVPTVHLLYDEADKIVTLEILESIVNQFIPGHIARRYKIDSIKNFLRKREIADIRHMFCYIAYSLGYKLTQIGGYLNDRDHTTVINSIRKCEQFIKCDTAFSEKYQSIIKSINEHIDNGDKLLHPATEESVDSESTLSSVLL